MVQTTIFHPHPDADEFKIETEAPKVRFPSGVDPYYLDRLFWIDRQFELWAAAYLFKDDKKSYADLCKSRLVRVYKADLYVQKRVEKLKRQYASDDSVVIAGLTGAEVIAYMEAHLPEPDPRALVESKPKLVRPSNLKDGRTQPDAVKKSGEGDGTGKSIEIWTWVLGALVLMSLGAVGLFARSKK